jgi:hypothetical protein
VQIRDDDRGDIIEAVFEQKVSEAEKRFTTQRVRAWRAGSAFGPRQSIQANIFSMVAIGRNSFNG